MCPTIQHATATRNAASSSEERPWKLQEHQGRTLMCDFHFANGNHRAFSYAYLSGLEYNPSRGIRLHFPSAEVMIEGRNLERLYDAFLTERVERVREGDPAMDFGEESEPFIHAMTVMPRRA